MSVYVMFVCLINTEFQKDKAGFSNKNFEDITLKQGEISQVGGLTFQAEIANYEDGVIIN